MTYKVNEAGQYVSEDGKWVWDGGTSAWTPAPEPKPEPEPTPEVTAVPTCAEQDCLQPASDYVRIAMQGVVGSITVECLLCTMHIATMEMGSQGQFLFIRPRNRLDLNGR